MKLMPFTIHPFEPSSASPQALPLDGHHLSAIQDTEIGQVDDPMSEDFQPEAALPPISVLTIGPFAQALAAVTAAIGAAWLPLPPMVHHFAIGGDGEQPKSMRDLPPSPHDAAWATTPTRRPGDKTSPVWLLLDLCVDQPPALAATVVDQRITWARQQLQRLALAVDHADGNNTSVSLLILADPARSADLERCRRRLTPLTMGPVYLIGAPMAEVETTAWQQRAATALAALLWGNLPAPALPAADATVASPWYTIGAAAQPSPTAPLIRTLALLTADEAVQARMTPAVADRQTDQSDALLPLVQLVTQLFAPAEALALPAPPPVRLRRTRPRWWRDSAHPVAMLLAYHHQQQRAQQVADQQVRSAWLTTRWSRWDTAWQAFSRIPSRPMESAIDLLHDVAPVEQVRRQILAVAQAVDEELETLAATITAQETQTQHECQALTDFCTDLPTLSLVGIWHFCRRPRRWPRWLWQLTVGLPWRLRRLSRCLTVQERVLHLEAHLHLRRQLALAMVQDVQAALAWQHEVRSYLTGLATYLEEQLTASLQALPPPWNRDRVAALRQDLIRADQVNRQMGMHALTALLQPTAAEEWVDSAVEAVGESLVEAFAAAFAPLQQWSVTAWLRAAFPPSRQTAVDLYEHGRWPKWRNGTSSPTVAPLTQWLDQLLNEATLLWPPAADQPNQPIEQWCLLPMSAGATAAPAEPPTVPHPDLDTWANAQPNRSYQQAPLQDLVAVQRMGMML